MPQIAQQGSVSDLTPAIPALTGLWQQLAQTKGSTIKVWLWLCTHLRGAEGADLPLGLIQEGTGLARSSVIRALADLIQRGVISEQERTGVATHYRWAAPAPTIGEGEGRVEQKGETLSTSTSVKIGLVPTLPTAPTSTKIGRGHQAMEQDTHTKSEPVAVGPEPDPSAAVPGARQEPSMVPAEPMSFCDGLLAANRIESTNLLTLEKETESNHAAVLPPETAGAAELAAVIARWSHCLQPGVAEAASKATRTRALRLWQQSAQSPADFSRLLALAGQRTLGRMGQAAARPVRCPISYFFGVLTQLMTPLTPVSTSLEPGAYIGTPAVSITRVEDVGGHSAPLLAVDTQVQMLAAPAPESEPPVQEEVTAPPAGLWRQALVRLKLQLPDDYDRVLRYAQLVELHPAAGQTRIVVPTEWMRRQIMERLTGPISAVLTTLTGQMVAVQVGVQ